MDSEQNAQGYHLNPTALECLYISIIGPSI